MKEFTASSLVRSLHRVGRDDAEAGRSWGIEIAASAAIAIAWVRKMPSGAQAQERRAFIKTNYANRLTTIGSMVPRGRD
jgi:hypothetical protein